MTTTEPTPYTFPDNQRGTVAGLIDAAKALLGSAHQPPAAQELRREDLVVNAKALAENVVTRVKNKPIPPALIAAAVGVGLVFLFSRCARGAALTAGSYAVDQYRKRR
jgi:hypothetical protein